ncbi:hypothetical protein F0U62_13690 [Cystobacter fuscus]|uniref:hypothetical protein n=1 Tax=Cystobacter fuscus TaxID=43 RepID=UPI002B2996B5|nr:hypothetical protein F0U62_13690 [Cystobacter fuscus]
MRIAKSLSPLAVVLFMSACGGPAPEESSSLATLEHELSSGVSRGCTFTTTYREVVIPHGYVPIIKRKASSTCPWEAATLELEMTYSIPNFVVVANDTGVAVAYATLYSPSAKATSRLSLWHVAPDTLSVVRAESLASYGEYSSRDITNIQLSWLSDGTTLKVKGRQSEDGAIPGQTGSGTYFVATWPDFFTSTTPASIIASPVWIP